MLRSVTSRASWCLAALIVATSSTALARERPVEEAIAVARASECLRQDALVAHVRVWLPRPSIDSRLAVVVEDEGAGASFVVTRDGEPVAVRRFDRLPPGCEDRRAALGIAIALAIDAAVLDALAAPRPAEVETATAPRASPAVALEVAAEGQVLFAVLPEVAAAWQIGARVVVEHAFEVGAYAWVTSQSGADLGPGRVAAQLTGGRLDLCARRDVEIVTLRGCAGAAAGAAFGTGVEVPGARSAVVGFAGLLGRIGVAIALAEQVALELAVDGWLSIWRPRFDLVDPNGRPLVSAELPAGGAMGAVGLAFRF